MNSLRAKCLFGGLDIILLDDVRDPVVMPEILECLPNRIWRN